MQQNFISGIQKPLTNRYHMTRIYRATYQLEHCLFGFHDISAWNAKNDRILVIETNDIKTPPSHTIEYPLYYVDNNGEANQFGSTKTFNYPQGARQQWIGDTNKVIVNDLEEGKVISKIYDTDDCKEIDSFPHSTHVITDKGDAFGLDYARLFSLGAYGYSGATDSTSGDDTPEKSGIVWHNIHTKESKIILSVKEVANYELAPSKGHSHYITHLVLSPNQKRIAFLHRYKLSDGGETTRLCTVGIDGTDLRCLITGFLSHFDWKDDEHVMIWGRIGSNVEKLRESKLYQLIPPKTLQFAKAVVKKIKGKSIKSSSTKSLFSWLLVKDCFESEVVRVAEESITEDGHPMFCPTNRDWMVCDNYPNKEGDRVLFLYQHSTDKRIGLGTFRRLFEKPDMKESMEILKNTNQRMIDAFGWDQLAFTRSGLHCDLHPRWSRDGKKIAFDSIHEGTRQVYIAEVADLVL